ncbi:hypothetical protein M501DRAFT_993526 [Patellaria atrata CBS 101060]|uniref:Zn(2)-C6 fungal-type domain-containing protein n=1 Tax=Patellaria atrata CBS 101060 TaxID=1346257 RepID=A0A9P4SI95_9PEZI|nr:hypothetical protein M501DRAFT_993526 [Patellaria atrata CBS 101060]
MQSFDGEENFRTNSSFFRSGEREDWQDSVWQEGDNYDAFSQDDTNVYSTSVPQSETSFSFDPVEMNISPTMSSPFSSSTWSSWGGFPASWASSITTDSPFQSFNSNISEFEGFGYSTATLDNTGLEALSSSSSSKATSMDFVNREAWSSFDYAGSSYNKDFGKSQEQVVKSGPSKHASSEAIAIPTGNKTSMATRSYRPRSSSNRSSNGQWFQYSVNNDRLSIVSLDISSNKRPRGRRGKLTPDQRSHAHLMRIVGSCNACRRRKEKCDPGSPCKACVEYYKGDLVRHPCRGRLLENLSATLLSENLKCFPSRRSVDQFLGEGSYFISSKEYVIPLNIGFGTYFQRRVRVVVPNDSSQLFHSHVVYDWPPSQGHGKSRCNSVFPAILSDTSDLKTSLNNHLSVLVDRDFAYFPVYVSSSNVLRDIYILYRRLSQDHNSILHTALKLLVLVHIGDDIQVPHSPAVQEILADVLPNNPAVHAGATPCFIRGQMGAVMPELARDLMRDILSNLERLSLSRNCSQWPIVLSAFALVLMTIESVQYHAARVPYHCLYDGNAPSASEYSNVKRQAAVLEAVDEAGVDTLLNFYKLCYGECHARLTEDAVEMEFERPDPGHRFVASLKRDMQACGAYFEERAKVKVGGLEDMDLFFDRLVARLLLLRTK